MKLKFIFQFIIQCYWFFIPKKSRRNCIFSESCSKHVYRINNEHGFSKAFKSLLYRYKTCRPGYKIFINEQKEYLIQLVDGTIIPESEIAPDLVQESILANGVDENSFKITISDKKPK